MISLFVPQVDICIGYNMYKFSSESVIVGWQFGMSEKFACLLYDEVAKLFVVLYMTIFF